MIHLKNLKLVTHLQKDFFQFIKMELSILDKNIILHRFNNYHKNNSIHLRFLRFSTEQFINSLIIINLSFLLIELQRKINQPIIQINSLIYYINQQILFYFLNHLEFLYFCYLLVIPNILKDYPQIYNRYHSFLRFNFHFNLDLFNFINHLLLTFLQVLFEFLL